MRGFIRNAIGFLVFIPVVGFFPYGFFLVSDLLADGHWVFPAVYIGYVLVVATVLLWRFVPRMLARRRRKALELSRDSDREGEE